MLRSLYKPSDSFPRFIDIPILSAIDDLTLDRLIGTVDDHSFLVLKQRQNSEQYPEFDLVLYDRADPDCRCPLARSSLGRYRDRQSRTDDPELWRTTVRPRTDILPWQRANRHVPRMASEAVVMIRMLPGSPRNNPIQRKQILFLLDAQHSPPGNLDASDKSNACQDLAVPLTDVRRSFQVLCSWV